MKLDGTDSLSTANEITLSLKGNHVTEPDRNTGPEVEAYTGENATTWSYLFVHHRKVGYIEEQLSRDGITYFIHKSVRYFKKKGSERVLHREMPTISGLLFLRGNPSALQTYLNQHHPYVHLCKSCSTGKPAVIPDSQMQPFMQVSRTSPDRIRFLLHPFHYYARNRILLRITTGDLAGLEGYVIRIDRDRRLVMDVGGISVAISGVHAEKFEEVETDVNKGRNEHIFYQRNLHERQALIDRYFHPVRNSQEAKAQAENIAYLRDYVLTEVAQNHMSIHESWRIFSFIIEEIGYYYAPFIEQLRASLDPIMQQGGRVLADMEHILTTSHIDPSLRDSYESEYQELMTRYEYLF